ncbi:MAG: glycosyltransferase, partial [Bacteroidia bacterium]
MPKVLRIINRFNLGGPTLNVSYLSKYLPDDFETILVGGVAESSEASSLFIPQQMGVEPILVEEMSRRINLFKDIKAFFKIIRLIKENKPDIVHTHASKAGTIGRFAAIICRVPIIVHTFHGHVFEGYFNSFKTNLILFLERFLAKKSNAIIAISTIQKNELCHKYKITSPEKCHVIPLGFDLKKFQEHQHEKRKAFRKKYNLNDDEIVIGIVGRLVPIKNHFLFLNAVKHVLEKTDGNVKAVIIGDGELKADIENFIQENYSTSQRNSILMIGWQTQMDEVINGLDIIALSSKNEGTPVSLIEAQAAGKIIVTTNVGGV